MPHRTPGKTHCFGICRLAYLSQLTYTQSHGFKSRRNVVEGWILWILSGFLRNCINCVHKDYSSFDFISAVLIWFILYTSITFIFFTGAYKRIIDQLPTSVASKLSWLEHQGFKSRLSPEFFQASYWGNCINCVHNCEDHSSFDFISAVLIWFISYTSTTIKVT